MNSTLRTLGALLILASLSACGSPQGAVSSLQTDGQIIGGSEATGNEDFTKTIVSVYNVSEGSVCTGSILSDSIILTAAHCVDDASPLDLRVIFGVELDPKKAIVKPVEAHMVSPIWPSRKRQMLNQGDVALVKITGGLPAGYAPAELLVDSSLLKDGQTTVLAGYGLSDVAEQTGTGKLRYVETTIKNAKYSASEALVEQGQGKGACHGDSGGPAYIKVNGKLLVWGVTSRGVDDPEDTCGVSAAYTNVAYYSTWIGRASAALMKAKPAQHKPGPVAP